MIAPTHAAERGLFEALRTGDESSIEHEFRELFPSLALEAATELEDSSHAARVVERAFLRVLNETAGITDVDALDAALHRALHESAVREKSRRAALHRFEHNEGVEPRRGARTAVTQAETDEAWSHVRDARRSAAAGAPPVVRPRHRSVHVGEVVTRRNAWIVPGVIVGVLALCGGAYGLSRVAVKPSEALITRSLAMSESPIISTANGQLGNATLADGSEAKMGAATRLRTGRDFGQSMRALSLDGSARIKVAAGSQPLELRLSHVAISMSSGVVDVRADSVSPTVVRVSGGEARVRTADSAWTAAAGQSFLVETNGSVRAPAAIEIQESLGWIDGRFSASGSLQDVVGRINRWYGADIGIGDASIMDRPTEVAGSLDSLAALMKTVQKSAGVGMRWTNGRMVLYRPSTW